MLFFDLQSVDIFIDDSQQFFQHFLREVEADPGGLEELPQWTCVPQPDPPMGSPRPSLKIFGRHERQ